MSKVIEPGVGRRVWLWLNGYQPAGYSYVQSSAQALDAGIAFVHSAYNINVSYADHNGLMWGLQNVVLIQPGDEAVPYGTPYCTWMPYQIEQWEKEQARKARNASASGEAGTAKTASDGGDLRRAGLDFIARVCHEVNRAYCQALGDNSQPAWEDAPDWQRSSARVGVDLHMMTDSGPEASHISWMLQKLDEGWKYGPVKNPETKEHPCLVPFDQLPRDQQAKDYIFRAVVHALK